MSDSNFCSHWEAHKQINQISQTNKTNKYFITVKTRRDSERPGKKLQKCLEAWKNWSREFIVENGHTMTNFKCICSSLANRFMVFCGFFNYPVSPNLLPDDNNNNKKHWDLRTSLHNFVITKNKWNEVGKKNRKEKDILLM